MRVAAIQTTADDDRTANLEAAGTLAGRLGDQGPGGRQVGAPVLAGRRLDGGNAHVTG